MGYTVATPIRDEESKARMLAFLEKNFKHWDELRGRALQNRGRGYRGPIADDAADGLSYDHGSCRIGFDFNTPAFDRDYIFAVCRWMALKVGWCVEFPIAPIVAVDGDELADPVCPGLVGVYPVIVYDGESNNPWPMIRDRVTAGDAHRWCVVDEFGCHDDDYRSLVLNKEFYGYDGAKIIRDEMKRLDALWTKED